MVANLAPLIVIVGPTASGKSAFALEIAKEYGGEIICADSRTVYKGMDIGTGKPSIQEQAQVRHHLLDLVTPDQTFTVVDFSILARETIKDIWQRGKWPILVGGSGLFVDAIIFNFGFGPKPSNSQRVRLGGLSVDELRAELINLQIPLPQNQKNKRHLIRAIEVQGLLQQKKELRPNTIVVGLATSREILDANIEARTQEMLRSGVVNEAKELAKKYGWSSEPMKSNIYRALKPVVEGRALSNEILEDIKRADRRLAKKQMTWFKRNKDIQWGVPTELKGLIESFVKKYSR